MIKAKQELKFCIQADRMMNRGVFKYSIRTKITGIVKPDYIMKYLETLRKAEYYSTRGGYYHIGINTD